jgi:hypothetical protein
MGFLTVWVLFVRLVHGVEERGCKVYSLLTGWLLFGRLKKVGTRYMVGSRPDGEQRIGCVESSVICRRAVCSVSEWHGKMVAGCVSGIGGWRGLVGDGKEGKK